MKSTGIVRRIDDLGRVVIPKEMRRTLGIKDGDALEIFTVEGGMCFKPYLVPCCICGERENTIKVGDKTMCTKCVTEFMTRMEEKFK